MRRCVMRPLFRNTMICALVITLAVLANTTSRKSRAAETNFDQEDATSFEAPADKPQNSVIAGFDFSNLDRSANACQDFNQFANGGWMARNSIPGAYSVWGRFTQLDEQNVNVLHDILDGLLKKKKLAPGNEEKIADFYGACMDEQKIEADGLKPLEPELQRISQISDLLSLEDEIA